MENEVYEDLIRTLVDALYSISEHAVEFDGTEDDETMIARMTQKANDAIAEAKRYGMAD
jgi:hypothetical protein